MGLLLEDGRDKDIVFNKMITFSLSNFITMLVSSSDGRSDFYCDSIDHNR